jgi:ABC-type branched-subunit amino acid transport system ATPase component
MTLLDLRRLTKHFGGLAALDSLDLSLAREAIHGLIGPNGSGKSTTLNLISGIYRPTAGKIVLEDCEISHTAPYQRAAAGIGRTFQNIRLFPTLTVVENVMMGRSAFGKGTLAGVFFNSSFARAEERQFRDQAIKALDFVGVAQWRDRLPGSLPYGHRRLVEIARVIASGAKLILLDEPAAGLNSGEKKELGELIVRINAELGVTILLVEHDMRLLMSISKVVSVLNFGKLVTTGSVGEIRAHPEVIKAYLGEGAPL